MPDSDQLAIDGGAAAFPAGPPSWPLESAAVREALWEAWSTGDWGRYHGQYVPRLERELAGLWCAPHVRLCCSGTVAVELALRGLQVEAGDEVLLAGYDFSGNFRAIEAVRARPVLVDLLPGRWTLDPGPLEQACSDKTRAIIVSHLHGDLAEIDTICAWAKGHGIAVVEDACQVPGARLDDTWAGTHGDVGVYSFGGSKLLTAGRGGAIVTADEAIHHRIKIQAERGNDAFAISELQAAALLAQLPQLAQQHQTRAANVRRLLAVTRAISCLQPVRQDRIDEAAYYKLGWFYRQEACGGLPRAQFLAALQAEGVAIDSGFRGFLRRGPRRCRSLGELVHSREAVEQTVLLHHPILLRDELIERLAAAIRRVAERLPRTDGR